MKILAIGLNPKFRKEGSNHVTKVSTYQDDDPEYTKIIERLTSPYYVLKLRERLERDQFIAFLEKLRTTPIKEILDAEAIKFVKKRYTGEHQFIVDRIIAVS